MRPAALESPQSQSFTIEQIYAPVQGYLLQVQESLSQIMTPEVSLLEETVSYAMGKPGKMFRPLLTLLASGASGTIGKDHIETAAVAELIHVATLLHDDVLDDSDTRRGQKTVKVLWGNQVAILSGDYLLAQASLKLSLLNNCRLVSIFAKVLANLCEGEVEQIRTSYNLNTNWETYYRKSICKTASLFSACCESAGVINQLPEPQIQRLKTFGEKFGIAFQIIDDLLDYTASAERLGKPVLDDLKNGLLNAPILLMLNYFENDAQKTQALTALMTSIFKASQESDEAFVSHKAQLFQFLEESDAIAKTEDLAKQYVQQAVEAIDFLPSNVYQQVLVGLTNYATQRDF